MQERFPHRASHRLRRHLMPPVSILLNILWIVFGGLWMAAGWVLAAIITGRPDIGTGPLGLIGNLIWLVLAGWWLALGHLVTAIALAVTIVGIPFAWAHFKLAGIALWPIGKVIVPA